MKATVKFVLVTIIMATAAVSANAQDFFYDKKYVNDQLVSQIKYEESYPGLFEKTYLHEYSFNEFGERIQEKVYKWNSRKSEWKHDYCITKKVDMENNTVFELATWNAKKGKYNNPSQKMVYKLDDYSNNLIYLAFVTDNF